MKKLPLVLLAAITACSVQKKSGFDTGKLQWTDLTYSYDSSTLYWPNNIKSFEHSTEAEGVTPLGYYYSSYSICTPEHGGTHLDAPIHFAANRLTADQIPLSSLTGNAVVIDVSAQALANRDYQIAVKDVEAWEKKNGKIPDNTIVLFRTGYGQFYPNREKYFGTALKGVEAIPLLHFPGVHPETTQWLVEKRNIKAMGLDTPSMDYGQSKDFKTHQVILGANKPGFENLANLDKLPATGVYIVALPMKIGKGSGAPLRIIAGVE
ncbi:MAG: cyclase family protein [Chitinophagaceae bacterium]|nr:cyclase family protein [Chitinophagaceae bacterium]MBL0153904.1 cyclase family protein [Chitinophagaceae bacterium]